MEELLVNDSLHTYLVILTEAFPLPVLLALQQLLEVVVAVTIKYRVTNHKPDCATKEGKKQAR